MADKQHRHFFPVFAQDDDANSVDELIHRFVARGEPITAGCGFVWLPTFDDAHTTLPLCEECSRLLDEGALDTGFTLRQE